MVSSVCGRSTMRMVMASTSILSQVTSGNSPATSAAISSHITMAWRWAFDLVTTVSSQRARARASAKAKRMMRVTPARVMTETSVATSSGSPRCTRPPTPSAPVARLRPHTHRRNRHRRTKLIDKSVNHVSGPNCQPSVRLHMGVLSAGSASFLFL